MSCKMFNADVCILDIKLLNRSSFHLVLIYSHKIYYGTNLNVLQHTSTNVWLVILTTINNYTEIVRWLSFYNFSKTLDFGPWWTGVS